MITCLLCFLALSQPYYPHQHAVGPEQYNVCHAIAGEAVRQSVDPFVVVAIGFVESRYRWEDKPNRRGAMGPLQVLPRYHCPGGRRAGCDYIEAGVDAYRLCLSRWPDEPLCHYNSGEKCYPCSRHYARTVTLRADRLRRDYRAAIDGVREMILWVFNWEG